MKKLLTLLIVLTGFSSGVFAFQNEADITLSIPFSFAEEKYTSSGMTTLVSQASRDIGIDLSDTFWLTKDMGFKVNFGFWWWAQSTITTKTSIGNSKPAVDSYTVNPDADHSSFMFNTFIAFAYKAVNSSIASITVAPGVNFCIDNTKSGGIKQEIITTGVGVDFTVRVYFAGDIYGVLSCPVGIDFNMNIDGQNNEDFEGRLWLIPKFGIGIRL